MEPTFVPRTPDAPEGDEYLMVPISRWSENLGEYVIFDTDDIIAGTDLPYRDPFPARVHPTRTLDGLPMILTDTEEAELRASVHGIVAEFGNEYFSHCSQTLQHPTELWDALAAGGFVGVNLPTEYGGGGMGLSALSIVAEEAAAAGCPQIMLMISPESSAACWRSAPPTSRRSSGWLRWQRDG